MKIPIIFSFFPLLANAYTWEFTSKPSQCQNVSIAIKGAGQPPYSFLIIPYGPTPLPNNVEVRTIQSIPFPGNSPTLSFKLNYPENSSFVAVVSDSSGFGSGGTSIPVAVLPSSDSSCYDASQTVRVAWVFNLNPTGGLTQCSPSRVWWQPSSVVGTANFYGAIPGGISFAIPQGSLTTDSLGTGFNWTVDIIGGTNVLLIAGDNRGIGSGGSAPFTISYAEDGSCLNSTSPSSTAGSPAGGTYPTSTSNPTTGNSGNGSHSSSHVGAIVGGVVGVAALLFSAILVTFYWNRRRQYSAISKERPVNVLQDDEDGNASHQDLPQYYAPDPFLVPDPTIAATSEAASTRDRPISMTTADIRPQTPVTATTTTTTRKSAAPPQLRPVNIIQHDDAGPSEVPGDAEVETIELPPAYTHIRQARRSRLATSTTTDAEGDS